MGGGRVGEELSLILREYDLEPIYVKAVTSIKSQKN